VRAEALYRQALWQVFFRREVSVLNPTNAMEPYMLLFAYKNNYELWKGKVFLVRVMKECRGT